MKKLHSKVRVTELGDVSNRLVELYKKTENLESNEFLKKSFLELENKGNAITEAVKKTKVISFLEEADKKRDKSIRILDKLLKGYEAIPVEDLKYHGEKLASIFKKYGVKILEENYSSQSNLIDSLLLDFASNEIKESIKALPGISEAIQNIKKAQSEFAKVRSEYERSLSSNSLISTASSLKKPLLDLINKKLIPYLSAMKIANEENYFSFIGEVSQIIESSNETIKMRLNKKAM